MLKVFRISAKHRRPVSFSHRPNDGRRNTRTFLRNQSDCDACTLAHAVGRFEGRRCWGRSRSGRRGWCRARRFRCRTCGDALAFDLEADFTTIKADATLGDDLRGGGGGHFLSSSFDSGVGLDCDGHSPSVCVNGVCGHRGPVAGRIRISGMFRLRTRIGT